MKERVVLVERDFPAIDSASAEVCMEIRLALRRLLSGRPDVQRVFPIELVAREAIQNAVDHGCGRDPSKRVRLSLVIEGRTVALAVTDSGPGFDVDAALARKQDPGPVASGNGLRIIAAYSEHFNYSDGGRTLNADFPLGEEHDMQETATNGIWSPQTDLVAANVQPAKEELRSLVAGSSGEFIVDLSTVAMVDSKGLGLLIAAINSLETAGRGLRIRGANADLCELFHLMRLDHHMTIG